MAGKGRRQRLPQEAVEAEILRLSHEGRGIAHVDGETVFIDGALPGERVRFVYTQRRRGVGEGRTVEVLQASADRIEPRCEHFGVCGACSLQHLPPAAQLSFKQSQLMEQFERIGKVRPEIVLPPLLGPEWGYRRRARLGARQIFKKNKVLVGFREKFSHLLADLDHCHVLDPRVGARLTDLGELVGSLSVADRIPQIEIAIGDNAAALVFRNVAAWGHGDVDKLVAFGQREGFHIYEQPGNEQTIRPLWPEDSRLYYELPAYGVQIEFLPADFTQVNADINRSMVDRALELLEPSGEDRVLDLFCGLGNFTLPLARRAGYVIGVEGEAGLVQRARDNAGRNAISNVEFHVADLTGEVDALPWMRGGFDKILLDPPRSGAAEMMPRLARLGAPRIVYVSCGPATLARDAGILVHQHGYRLRAAGVMDMFPHTAHVESIALFERD